jgi:hypothetical protein
MAVETSARQTLGVEADALADRAFTPRLQAVPTLIDPPPVFPFRGNYIDMKRELS